MSDKEKNFTSNHRVHQNAVFLNSKTKCIGARNLRPPRHHWLHMVYKSKITGDALAHLGNLNRMQLTAGTGERVSGSKVHETKNTVKTQQYNISEVQVIRHTVE